MPKKFNMTSYGHCYYVLILAHLIKSGIQEEDSEINSCINFASHFAFYMYEHQDTYSCGEEEFERFKENYKKDFVIKDTIINRLQNRDYGIIKNRKFRAPYMYYYFLGKYLSDNSDRPEYGKIIEDMADKSYVNMNRLALIFIIHHSHNNKIIDEILLRTMCSLENIEPATLSPEETKNMRDFVSSVPKSIASEKSVEEERRKQRDVQDLADREEDDFDGRDEREFEELNHVYRILKNNEILGQILRNKYGSLEKSKIMEIIKTIADGGLRTVKLILMDQEQINKFAGFIHRRDPDLDIEKIRFAVQTLMFWYTVMSVDKIATAINKPEIRSLVEEVFNTRSIPAYDLISYFSLINSVENFDQKENVYLGNLLSNHEDDVIRTIVSLKTQNYMNTHRVKESTVQSVYSKLKIPYQKRLLR